MNRIILINLILIVGSFSGCVTRDHKINSLSVACSVENPSPRCRQIHINSNLIASTGELTKVEMTGSSKAPSNEDPDINAMNKEKDVEPKEGEGNQNKAMEEGIKTEDITINKESESASEPVFQSGGEVTTILEKSSEPNAKVEEEIKPETSEEVLVYPPPSIR